MRIGVIGAGFAGLSAVKVLRQFGHEVTVFERAPDVGGVWSRTRRYPGVETQNNRDSYCFSDFPMPKSYPEWPTGPQVQEYLVAYVERFDLGKDIRLDTDVVSAEPTASGWQLTTQNTVTGERDIHTVEYLIVANGIFCYPFIPEFAGREEYEGAGGRILHTSQIHQVEDARGRNVVVVGYGKSACDFAVAVSDAAATTSVIARELIWKMPKRPGGLNMKYLLLTRMGEGLFRYIRPRGFERFLHGRGKPVRDGILAGLQALVTRQLRLKQLGLVPRDPLETIARSTVSLATDGFSERVEQGIIAVRRDTVIERLCAENGRPSVRLSDGQVLSADLVVSGTGWQQRVPFFSEELERRLTDERGNFELHRQIQPLDVPRVSFCGYNSSFFSPLSAEVAAWWIACFLMGEIQLPPSEQVRGQLQARLRWMEQRTDGHHARGTNVIPFSMHNIDEMLEDVRINVSAPTRAVQWVLPTNPAVYAKIEAQLLERRKSLAGQPRAEPDALGG
ncbi:MAG: NAD(P)/FAD-dependent oxidoreductase [Solirubrobacterales bacterium]|nr:NAD(P)/FAD-dependent oxidoreductase [Solirubrobacterales bacterium]